MRIPFILLPVIHSLLILVSRVGCRISRIIIRACVYCLLSGWRQSPSIFEDSLTLAMSGCLVLLAKSLKI